MKFQPPPEWPQPPDGWIPDPTWKPDADWPSAPSTWQFWTNDYGVPVEGPPGLYGSSIPRVRWTRRILTGVGAFFALVIGIGIGGSSSPDQPAAAPLLAVPTHTVTLSPTPTPTPAPTVTVTAPPETVTVPPETITLPVETVTVEVQGDTSSGFGLLGGSDSNSGSGGSASVYYRNCSAARAAGAAPIYRGEPGYRSGLDRDNDGVACE